MAIVTSTSQVLKKVASPPGPRPLPYFGNFLGLLLRNQTGYFDYLYRTYGEVVTFYQGKVPIIMLFRPEDVRSVLVENASSFLNRPPVGSAKEAAQANDGLLTIDGEKHRQQRHAVQPAFHKKYLANYVEIMTTYTHELLDSWNPRDIVDMSQAMQKLTLRIINKCLFSVDLRYQLPLLNETFTTILGKDAGVLETLSGVKIDHPLTSYGKRAEAFRRLDILVDTLIAQRRADERDWGDVLSMLLAAPDGERPGKITNKQVYDHITSFITAGHETTTLVVVWMVYLLSKYPLVREKLLNEIRTVLGDRPLNIEDLDQLPYTGWVLNETLRLYPPGWFQARYAAEDVEMSGYRFPKGTRFLLSQWVMHRRPDLWDEPEVFCPERWDPVHGQKIVPGSYFPFGGGPRTCIGMPFAQLEAKIILVSLLQRFIPHTVPGYRPSLNPTVTLRPKHNLLVTLYPYKRITRLL